MKQLLSVLTVVVNIVFKGKISEEQEEKEQERERKHLEAEERLEELTSRVESVQREYRADRFDR